MLFVGYVCIRMERLESLSDFHNCSVVGTYFVFLLFVYHIKQPSNRTIFHLQETNTNLFSLNKSVSGQADDLSSTFRTLLPRSRLQLALSIKC